MEKEFIFFYFLLVCVSNSIIRLDVDYPLSSSLLCFAPASIDLGFVCLPQGDHNKSMFCSRFWE